MLLLNDINSNLKYLLNLNSRSNLIKEKNKLKLNLLPIEILCEIISYLDIKDLVNLCQSFTEFEYLYKDEYLMNNVKIGNLENYIDRADIIEVLFKYKKCIDVSREEEIGNLFMGAAKTTNIPILKLFLLYFNLDFIFEDDTSIIEWAVHNQYSELLELLLNAKNFDPSINNNAAFICACRCNYIKEVKLLLADPRVNPADQNNEAIIKASQHRHLKIVELLLTDPKVNPADQNNEAIIKASLYKHLEIVELLLADPRVNPSVQNNVIFKHIDHVDFFSNHKLHKKLINLLLTDKRVNPNNLTYEEFIKQLNS